MRRPIVLGLLSLMMMVVAACRPAAETGQGQAGSQTAANDKPTLVLASHDSFSISEEVIAQFEAESGATVQFLSLGDAGEALNKLILSKEAPLADLFFGVDNTFLSRALDDDVFVAYDSPRLSDLPDDVKLDAQNRLIPVDVGYVNINADKGWYDERGLPLPQTLEDLALPQYAGQLVVQNPAASSPGLAFLLTTISHFGEDGYLDFWSALRENDVLITDGWSEAYYNHFTVGSGGSGDRPLVISYSTSPPADVLYATDGRTEPASVNINPPDGTFRQIEFVGIINGTNERALAEQFIDFMLSDAFQEDLPLQMFVYPVSPTAELPDLFVQYAETPSDPAAVDPAAIEANREGWIQAWTNTMLR